MERLDRDLRGELERLGVPADAALTELVAAWPRVAGEAVARNAWPLRVARDGTLHVAASSATWAYELGRMAPMLLERLRSELGDGAPKALRFAPGPIPEPPPADFPGDRRTAPEPTAEERRQAAALVAGTDDEELRLLAERAAAATLARRRSSGPI